MPSSEFKFSMKVLGIITVGACIYIAADYEYNLYELNRQRDVFIQELTHINCKKASTAGKNGYDNKMGAVHAYCW